MARFTEFAAAKINLSLRVPGKRPDGYHQLESLVCFADVGDQLTVEAADGLSLAIIGPFSGDLISDPDNLILRAARLFAGATGLAPDWKFSLTKNLPLASGIGGGSADAAAALRGLVRLTGRQPVDLNALALELGADVPVCLKSAPCLMSGIGEILSDTLPLPPLAALLINPGVAVPTGPVFQRLNAPLLGDEPTLSEPPLFKTRKELIEWVRSQGNDLQAPARVLQPAIGDVLEALGSIPQCEMAAMSGSGATCFGLFASWEEAQAVAVSLSGKHPDWWCMPARLGAAPA